MKVAGRWHDVYQAIDQSGQVVDVFVSARRDAKAARRSVRGRLFIAPRAGKTPQRPRPGLDADPAGTVRT